MPLLLNNIKNIIKRKDNSIMALDRKKPFQAAFFINRKNTKANKKLIFTELDSVMELETQKDYAEIYRNTNSKTKKTFLAQPIAEALALLIKILTDSKNNKSIFCADESRCKFSSKLYIPSSLQLLTTNDKINSYKVTINLEEEQIYVAAYDNNEKIIPIETPIGPMTIISTKDQNKDIFHLHDMNMLLPIFATYFLIKRETYKEANTLINQILNNEKFPGNLKNSNLEFIKLCEDLYQENKNEVMEITYCDNAYNIEYEENIINTSADLGQIEEISLDNFIPKEFTPNDFKEYQLDYIPKLPPEMVLDEEIKVLSNAIYTGDCIATLFHGPAGTGKTANCKLICQQIHLPIMEIINCTESSDESVLGKYIPQEEKIIFKESKIVEAIRNGGAVVFEEINFSKPQHTAFLNSLLDDNGFVILDNGEKVKRNKNFRFFATMNYGYAGTRPLNEATYNRFNCIYKVNELPIYAIENMLKTRVPECEKMLPKIIQIYQKIKNLIKTMESETGHISPRNLENWAKMAKYTTWKKAAECTIIPCANFDEDLEKEIKKILKGL